MIPIFIPIPEEWLPDFDPFEDAGFFFLIGFILWFPTHLIICQIANCLPFIGDFWFSRLLLALIFSLIIAMAIWVIYEDVIESFIRRTESNGENFGPIGGGM